MLVSSCEFALHIGAAILAQSFLIWGNTMKRSGSSFRIVSLLLVLLLVTACTSLSETHEPSAAALTGDPDAMWADGQKAIAKGESLVKNGESRLREGRAQVREGEDLVHRGGKAVMQSRQDYQTAALAAGSASNPDGVKREAKRLKTIGSRWEDAIEQIKDGNKLIAKGSKNIRRGQTEIRKGRALLESGSTLMRNAERIRLGEQLLPVAPHQP